MPGHESTEQKTPIQKAMDLFDEAKTIEAACLESRYETFSLLLNAVKNQLSAIQYVDPGEAETIENITEISGLSTPGKRVFLRRNEIPNAIMPVVHLTEENKITAIGDTHGDFICLSNAIFASGIFGDSNAQVFILGDVIDRGIKSFLNLITVLLLLRDYHDQVIFVLGNHEEALRDCLAKPSPPELSEGYDALQGIFTSCDTQENRHALLEILNLFPCQTVTRGKFSLFLSHGGIAVSYDENGEIIRSGTERQFLVRDFLSNPVNATWGEYNEWDITAEGRDNQDRGCGQWLGKKALDALALVLGMKSIREIRGHNHKNDILTCYPPHEGLTLFSTSAITSVQAYEYFFDYVAEYVQFSWHNNSFQLEQSFIKDRLSQIEILRFVIHFLSEPIWETQGIETIHKNSFPFFSLKWKIPSGIIHLQQMQETYKTHLDKLGTLQHIYTLAWSIYQALHNNPSISHRPPISKLTRDFYQLIELARNPLNSDGQRKAYAYMREISFAAEKYQQEQSAQPAAATP